MDGILRRVNVAQRRVCIGGTRMIHGESRRWCWNPTSKWLHIWWKRGVTKRAYTAIPRGRTMIIFVTMKSDPRRIERPGICFETRPTEIAAPDQWG